MDICNFKLINTIGYGGYGKVILAKCKNKLPKVDLNELVAIKIVRKTNSLSINTEVKVCEFIIIQVQILSS